MENILNKIKDKFQHELLDIKEHSSKRIYITVDRKNLFKIADYLFRALSARFNTASGADCPGKIEILYHFSFDKPNKLISIKVDLPKQQPQVDSITPIIKGAEWIEREIHDLLGVNFRNHPNLKRFILPENWTEGEFPLRSK